MGTLTFLLEAWVAEKDPISHHHPSTIIQESAASSQRQIIPTSSIMISDWWFEYCSDPWQLTLGHASSVTRSTNNGWVSSQMVHYVSPAITYVLSYLQMGLTFFVICNSWLFYWVFAFHYSLTCLAINALNSRHRTSINFFNYVSSEQTRGLWQQKKYITVAECLPSITQTGIAWLRVSSNFSQ